MQEARMKTDNRQRLLIIVTGVVLAFFVGDKLVYSPLAKWWKVRGQEIAKLRADVNDGAARIKRETVIRERWDEMRRNTLPNNPSQAQERLIKALQDWAQESNVSLNGTNPQWKNDAEDYRTLVYRVDATGSLWQLCRFIYHIEKGPMGLKLESVDITSSRDNTGQQLALGLQLSGLVLTPQTQ
jgi:Tfp pilus assembly protein PilO